MKLLILNGPNLNLLGQREPEIYGSHSYDDLCKLIYEHAAAVGCQVELFQSNHEGTLIDAIQASRAGYGGIVINPGAYAHYSYAIYDALRCAPVPAVEVHISDITAREPFRAVSVTAPACVKTIAGHGLEGYMEAMDYLLTHGKDTAGGACGCGGGGGMTAKLCLIGDPIGHSLSPLIHGAMIAQTGAPYTYELHPVPSGALAAFTAAARDGAWAGCNVTMPHKTAIVPLLDALDGSAAACGAVNTVCFRQGRAVGYSTDGCGFVDSLRFRGIDPAGRTVLLLGAGGAAASVCLALAQAGAARIIVAARRPEQARALCALCPGQSVPASFRSAALCRAAAESTLLVNATSLGMTGMGAFPDLAFLRAAPAGAVVYDLVYQPRRTALLAAAESLGLTAVPGTALLIHQAVRAFTLFTGETADVAALYRALEGKPG